MITEREEANLQELEEVEMDFYAGLMFLCLSRLTKNFNIQANLGEAGISQETVKDIVIVVYKDLNARNLNRSVFSTQFSDNTMPDLFPPVTDREVEPCVRVFFTLWLDKNGFHIQVFSIDGLGEKAKELKDYTVIHNRRQMAIDEFKHAIRRNYAPNAKFYRVDLEEF